MVPVRHNPTPITSSHPSLASEEEEGAENETADVEELVWALASGMTTDLTMAHSK